MFSWFSSKKTDKEQQQQKQQKQQEKKQEHNEEQWVYDFIVQYLTSPLWKAPIQQFIDENCHVFENQEENHFEYTEIHNRFKEQTDGNLEWIVKELGIDDQQFMNVIQLGLKNQQHRRVFEQIIIIDNFVVFKKLMLKRNKELELEAIKQLETQGQTQNVQIDQQQIQKLEIENEKAEIDYIMEQSLAIEKERQRLLEQEEQELQQILQMSMITYQEEQDKISQKQLPDEQLVQQSQQQLQHEQKQETKQQQQEEIQQQKQVYQPQTSIKNLPPLKGKIQLDAITLDSMNEHKQNLEKELIRIDNMNKKKEEVDEKKEDKQQEDMEERKKRLLAQRDLILKKKQKERNEEVINYQQKVEIKDKEVFKPSDLSNLPKLDADKPTISNEELEKRREIMQKIKDKKL